MKSYIVPWHNEWLAILLYTAFAIYFWVETFLIMAKSSIYKFKHQHEYDLMFLATLGMAISLTCTTIYLVFYSISEKVNKILDSVDYMGKITMVFLFSLAFIGNELVGSFWFFALIFLLGALLILNLVLV